MKSDLPNRRIDIVIPKTQIPTWCNKQNVGGSIRMDPLPNMDDKNLIGVACCITFVAHDHPTNLGEGWLLHISVSFCSYKGGWCSIRTPLHIGTDLITVDLEHLLLTFFTREAFKGYAARVGFHDDDNIELVSGLSDPPGLHFEAKNCGYRWIFKEDLDKLNPQMMFGGNSSVQNMYLTND